MVCIPNASINAYSNKGQTPIFQLKHQYFKLGKNKIKKWKFKSMLRIIVFMMYFIFVLVKSDVWPWITDIFTLYSND